jgi:hypothetical protein
MPSCQHRKTKKNILTGEDGGNADIEQEVCSEESCSAILREWDLLEGVDGEVLRRPRRLRPPEPENNQLIEGFDFPAEKRGETATEPPNANEMTKLAMKQQKELVLKAPS